MRTYRTRRRGGTLAYLLALVFFLSGLVLVVYSFMIGDPFASAAIAQDPPHNARMTLTVPEMRRVDHVAVYNGTAGDEGALHDGTLHVKGTGFPWQEGANVYIAGHPGERRQGNPHRRERHKIHLQRVQELRGRPRRLLRHRSRSRQERRHPADVHPARLRPTPHRSG